LLVSASGLAAAGPEKRAEVSEYGIGFVWFFCFSWLQSIDAVEVVSHGIDCHRGGAGRNGVRLWKRWKGLEIEFEAGGD